MVTNDVWELNQSLLQQSRTKYSEEEKDTLLKQALYSKLKEKKFTKPSQHAKLFFDQSFEIDGKVNIKLCESCYVGFNDHICKNVRHSDVQTFHLTVTICRRTNVETMEA